jgi:HSP20 family protein
MWSLPEADDLAADVRRLLDDLDREGRGTHPGTTLHAPALDVFETPTSVEIVVDLPGVAAPDIRVIIKHGALLLAGEKHPPAEGCQEGADFHLVERSFGRFARVVRFDHAVNAARARATLGAGVLRVTVPRIVERRGREIAVPIEPRAS